MRDRLIGMIDQAYEKCKYRTSCRACSGYGKGGRCLDYHIADYLLAEGVIVPPCKIGTHLWKITYPYRQEPKVTEFVVKNFKTVGKRHKIQIEVQAVNVPTTSWMYYTAFYTTKEEAEAKLKGEQ